MARRSKDDARFTSESIISSSIELFLQYGIPRTNLAMVAERSRITRGAIYWHFKNKDEIVTLALSRGELPMFCLSKQLMGLGNVESKQQLFDVFYKVLRLYNDHNSIHRKVAQIVYVKSVNSLRIVAELEHEEESAHDCVRRIEDFLIKIGVESQGVKKTSEAILTVWKALLYESLLVDASSEEQFEWVYYKLLEPSSSG